MNKKVIVTAGPTDERIDDVMQITNPSGGTLGCKIAETLLRDCNAHLDKLYYISTKRTRRPHIVSPKLVTVTVKTAEDMKNAISEILTEEHIDLFVHNAAVGDYKARYSARAEDIAKEITDALYDASITNPKQTDKTVQEIIMDVLRNPKCAADDSGKMSSNEPNLMTMMDLTPKVIKSIKQLSPKTVLIGSKLLDRVSEPHLFEVADHLATSTGADFIIANDLANVSGDQHEAMIIGNHRILTRCHTKADIANVVAHIMLYGQP